MKNYYEILGVEPDALEKEIQEAFNLKAKLFSKGLIARDEFDLAVEAYQMLSNKEFKEEYDKAIIEEYLEDSNNLSEVEFTTAVKEEVEPISEEKEDFYPIDEIERDNLPVKSNKKGRIAIYKAKAWFKKNAPKLLKGIAIGTAVVVVFCAGRSCAKNDKNNSNHGNTSSITDTQNNTLILDASNFTETVSNIIKENHDKGLDVKENIVYDTLLLANLNNLSDNDLAILASNIDMQTALQNLLDYVSMVESHNLNNDEKISLATLVYNKVDREVLAALNARYNYVVNNIETMDKGQISAVMNEIYEFTIGSNGIQTETGNYHKLNLGDGAGLISESYVNLIANEIRNVTTNEYKKEINAISENTRGMDYINGIYKTEIPCLEEKTLVK